MLRKHFTKAVGILLVCTPLCLAAAQTPQSKPIVLTLHDAIILALRDSPTLEQAELDRITQKYSLLVAENEFEPQYSFSATTDHSFSGRSDGDRTRPSTTFSASPSVSLKNTYGTDFTLGMTNAATRHGNYLPGLSLSISQPLIQGFGRAIVEQALKTARETEIVNKLTLTNTIKTTINDVINAYLDVVQQQQRIEIDKNALKNYKITEENTRVLIKTGRRARNDIVQAQSSVASQEATLRSDETTLRDKKFTLFSKLGLEPDANIIVPSKLDITALIKQLTHKKKLPGVEEVKKAALAYNLAYQQAKYALLTTSRSVLSAKDALRWALNLTADLSRGPGAGSTEADKGLESVFANNRTHAASVGLTLTIPIDNVSDKQALVAAKIALEKAKIALNQQRKEIQKQAVTDRDNLVSIQEQIHFDRQALELQEKTVEITNIKHSAGLISGFELLTEQAQLTQNEQSLVSSLINYIQSLVAFNFTMGQTLNDWNISLRED